MSALHDEMPRGLIIITHQQLARLDGRMIQAALPDAWSRCPRVHLPLVLDDERDARLVRWDEARQRQQRWLREVFDSARQDHPAWRVVYLGAAHISLAMELGVRIGARAHPSVIGHAHGQTRWGWPGRTPDEPAPTLTVEGVPTEPIALEGAALMRVHASRAIDPAATRAAVFQGRAGALAEVDVRLTPITETPCRDEADVTRIVDACVASLRALLTTRPGLSNVHLFLAGPPALSFALGAALPINELPRVHVYQHIRACTPPFRRVLTLNREDPDPPAHDEAQARLAKQARVWWGEELDALQRLQEQLRRDAPPEADWLTTLGIPNARHPTHHTRAFARLDAARALQGTLAQTWREDIDGFRYEGTTGQWWLTASLLRGLTRRVQDEARVRRAGRLFFLHEAAHLSTQRLTGFTSPGAGRKHPELVEIVDYHADVWAMTHELVHTLRHAPTASPRATLGAIIEDALETFWAFDDGPGQLQHMQRRRLRRYLMWAWQRIAIASTADTLDAVVTQLTERPVISLSGLPSWVDLEGRLMVRLDRVDETTLELAALSSGRVIWHGAGGLAPLHTLVRAMRTRDTGLLLNGMRVIFEQHHAL